MKKKFWIGSIVLIVLIIVGIGWYWWYNTQKIRNEVLDQLKERLEFCEIVKDDVNALNNKGEFWLICNTRPFYATYENGKVNYELNGWGFLKEQPEILNEIQKGECNFYDFSENKLTFICKNKMAKIFQFSDFKLKKIEETPSINQFSESLRSRYDFILSGERGFEMEGETFFKLTGERMEKDIILAYNFKKRYFTLPTVIEEGLTGREKAELSFQLLNVCKIDYIQEMGREVLVGLDCNLGKPVILYDLENGLSHFLIKESEFEILFPYLGKYNLFGMAGAQLKYLREEEKDNQILKYYLAKDKVIVAKSLKGSGLISEIYFKGEGI